MIKGILQNGRYTVVSGGAPSNPYISPGSHGAGMVRWNSNMNHLEVNDGISWKEITGNFASVGLSPEAESLLDWASQKRAEELEIKSLAATHPAVKAALEAVEKAQEQLQIIRDLSIDHEPS
jgi:hypothetical protein